MILAVESSCDETGVALYDGNANYLAHKLYSQVALHREFGGVVPELASRDHIRKLLPLCREVLDEQGVEFEQIRGVAYTAGPGLMGALLVAATWACGLAMGLEVPLIPVNHLEGHLMAVFLEEHRPDYPFLGLLISGGNTMLVEVIEFGKYRLLGSTLDDAVGEAFDKVAKVMGLGYPGGAQLSNLAEMAGKHSYQLPVPMLHHSGYDFSFSGLKTEAGSLIRRLQMQGSWSEEARSEVAHAFQEAAVQSIVFKVKKALCETGHRRLVVAGGVSANRRLRDELQILSQELSAELFLARPEFCTDNGAMIAVAGWEHWVRGEVITTDKILVNPRWRLGSGLTGLVARS